MRKFRVRKFRVSAPAAIRYHCRFRIVSRPRPRRPKSRDAARATPQLPPIMDTETIKNLIERGLPGAQADVQGADGVHFEAVVVSDTFAGKLPLARHRLVYATLGELMGREIHALSLKTLTRGEAGLRA
jgi:acid stress-induced BolA-like protein IbaG/YrbA